MLSYPYIINFGLVHKSDLSRNIHIQQEFVREDKQLLQFILSSRLETFSFQRDERSLSQDDFYYYDLMDSLSRSPSRLTLVQMALNLTPHLVNREFRIIGGFQNLRELRLYDDMSYVFILSGMPRHDEDSVWKNPVAVILSIYIKLV